MTPKKPTLTKDRRAWLKSLKLGDKVIVWQKTDGWRKMWIDKCEPRFLRARDDGPIRTAWVLRGSGIENEYGRFIFPTDDVAALEGLRLDEARRLLSCTKWQEIPDSVVDQIDAILKAAGRVISFDVSGYRVTIPIATAK